MDTEESRTKPNIFVFLYDLVWFEARNRKTENQIYGYRETENQTSGGVMIKIKMSKWVSTNFFRKKNTLFEKKSKKNIILKFFDGNPRLSRT